MPAFFGGLFIVLLCVDIGIKQHVEDSFKLHEDRKTMIDKIVLRKVYNQGFLLNTLDRYPVIIKGSSVIVGAFIVLYDFWLFVRKGRWIEKLGMVFLSAGAASNIYDRLVRGKVIDYIGVKSMNSFLGKLTANLADVYVAVGAVIILVSRLFRR